MGHAHHFLSRLDRVSMPQVELALSLYRDEELLRFVFERARIPEAVEKVAISLDHPEEGPFVIVTRSGRFVTCLGAGMKTKDDQPIITKGQLDAFAAKRESLRERMALANGQGVKHLLRRIYESADQLSREEFLAISSLQPLYAQQFMALYITGSSDLIESRKILLLQLGKSNRPSARLKEPLLMFWRTLWALGHLAVLASMDGTETLSEPAAALFDSTMTVSWPAVKHGFLPTALRGTWAAARMGKAMLPRYKRWYEGAGSLRRTIDGALGLFAMGVRHSKLRAETSKFLENEGHEPKGETRYDLLLDTVRKTVHFVYKAERAQPEQVLASHRALGASMWIRMCNAGMVQAGPYRFQRQEDVPDEVAMPMAINAYNTFLMQDKTEEMLYGMATLFQMVPWVARSAPEDLYPPREVIKAQMLPWIPEKSLTVLFAFREHNAWVDRMDPKKNARTAGPPRQGPCPCGSGKKYKRCCEEKEKSPPAG